jgi:hypothetical protein
VGKGSPDGSFPRQSFNDIRQYMSYKIDMLQWSAMNMFTHCNVYITVVCSVNITSYFLRRSRVLYRFRYHLDTPLFALVDSHQAEVSSPRRFIQFVATAADKQRRRRVTKKGTPA